MKTGNDVEKCFSFINYQLQPPRAGTREAQAFWKAVTISRQAGSGGHVVGETLAALLSKGPGASPWRVFDRDLVEKVIEDHNLPQRMARFMTEDRMSEISDTLDELFGLHPPSWTLVRNTADTILHLVELGNVILIGRGAGIVTSGLSQVFHVRLVAPVEKRIEYIAEHLKLSAREARSFVLKEDRGRQRYLKKYFGKNIDDPLLYHLVINTDLVGYEEAAAVILAAMRCERRRQ